MSGGKKTVAIVQAQSGPVQGSGLERASALVREAATAGEELIVQPETWLPSSCCSDEPRVIGAELDRRRARDESMTLAVTGHFHSPDLFDFRIRSGGRAGSHG